MKQYRKREKIVGKCSGNFYKADNTTKYRLKFPGENIVQIGTIINILKVFLRKAINDFANVLVI